MHDGIVSAINIKIESVNVCRIKVFEAIRRDKSSRFGIVVATVQIVEPGFRIVIIPAIAERVNIQDFRADLRKKVAPRIVFVLPEQIPAGVINPDDIPLQVLPIETLLLVVCVIITDSRLVVNMVS